MNTFYFILLKKTRFYNFPKIFEIINDKTDKKSSLFNYNEDFTENNDIIDILIYYEIVDIINEIIANNKTPDNSISIDSFINKTHKKFNIFDKFKKNIFLTYDKKEEFTDIFQSSQKTYHVLNRFVFNYKMKKTPTFVSTDLYMSPIEETQKNVISIIQNDKKYLFTIQNLINIIESSLCNSPYFISTPLPIKNPYTNIPFEKWILYNIYFQLRFIMINIHPVFHAYFMTNFNLLEFREENDELINKYSVEQYIKTVDDKTRYELCFEMIDKYDYLGYLNIHPEFPPKMLIEIMKPYIELYIETLYSSSKYYKTEVLRKQLNKFIRHNVKFGRIKINHIMKQHIFNDNHPKYTKYEYNSTFNSHYKTTENDFITPESIYNCVPRLFDIDLNNTYQNEEYNDDNEYEDEDEDNDMEID